MVAYGSNYFWKIADIAILNERSPLRKNLHGYIENSPLGLRVTSNSQVQMTSNISNKRQGNINTVRYILWDGKPLPEIPKNIIYTINHPITCGLLGEFTVVNFDGLSPQQKVGLLEKKIQNIMSYPHDSIEEVAIGMDEIIAIADAYSMTKAADAYSKERNLGIARKVAQESASRSIKITRSEFPPKVRKVISQIERNYAELLSTL